MEFREPTMNTTNEQLPEEDRINNKPEDENRGNFNEQELEDLEIEVDEAIEEDKRDETSGEEYENERVVEWENKSPEKKKKAIEEKKSYFEENLEDDLKKDSENIDELEVPEGIMEEIGKLQEYKEKLREVNKTFIEGREDALSGINSQTDGNIDISSLSSMEQGEFRNVLSGVKNVTQNTLDIEKIDYYLTKDNSLTEEGIEKGLLGTHEDRLIAMEKLEYILKQIGEFEKCLEEMSNMETAREDIEKMVKRMIEIADENPSLFEKLKDAGIIAGIIMLASAVGAAGVAKLIGIAGPLAAKIYSKKIAIGVVGVGGFGVAANAGTIAGALVSGGVLLKIMSWLSSEKNRDGFAEWACGAKIPFRLSKQSESK